MGNRMQSELFGSLGEIKWMSRTKGTRQEFEHRDINVRDRKLIVFELGYTGHYPNYIQHLAKYWCEQELPGRLDIVVSPKFVQHHADVVDIASTYNQKSLKFVAITLDEEASLIPRKSSINRALRSFQEWNLLRKYATTLGATQCLLLYFDSFQAAVASGAKLPCLFSGIYFRPTFHYSDFTHYVPSLKDSLQQWREKYIILPRVLRHPQLQNLFCLDPFVIKHIKQFASKAKVVHLPDPVLICSFSEQELEKFKQSLKIDPSRKVFLLFGALYDGRKGIHQLLEAISKLSPILCQKLCLLLVGQIGGTDKSPIQTRISEISQSLPVQIIVRDEFVPEQEVPMYFQIADVILAPYQRHVGMSGTLVEAAAAQKPLLSSDYGLLGAITRHWQLGLTVASTVPSEITKGLTRFLLESPEGFGDRNKMKAFAEQNSAERFANVIFQCL